VLIKKPEYRGKLGTEEKERKKLKEKLVEECLWGNRNWIGDTA